MLRAVGIIERFYPATENVTCHPCFFVRFIFCTEIFLPKHRGFADFPITSGLSLSVLVAFVQSSIVIRSLSFFFPFTGFVANV